MQQTDKTNSQNRQRQGQIDGRRYSHASGTDLQTQAKTDACCIRLQHIAPCVLGPETAASKAGFSSDRVCSTPRDWAFGTPPDWAVECEQEMGGHGIYSAVPKGDRVSRRQAKVTGKRGQ